MARPSSKELSSGLFVSLAVFLFAMWCLPLHAFSAEVKDTVVSQSGNRIEFRYDLIGDEPEAEVTISLMLEGKEYQPSDLHLEGDIGNVKLGKGRNIYWDVLLDFPRGIVRDIGWKIVTKEGLLSTSSTQKNIRILDYAVKIIPSETVRRGEGAQIVTSFDLVVEPIDSPIRIEEERSMISPSGKELSKKRYVYKGVDRSGGYEFRTNTPIPTSIDLGFYEVTSTLFVNGNAEGKTNFRFQVR